MIYITCFSTRCLKIPFGSSICKWLPLCGSNKSFYVILIDGHQLRSFCRLAFCKYKFWDEKQCLNRIQNTRQPVSLITTYCVPWFDTGRLSFDSVVLGGSSPSASTTTTGWSFGSASSVVLSMLSEIVIFGLLLPVI